MPLLQAMEYDNVLEGLSRLVKAFDSEGGSYFSRGYYYCRTTKLKGNRRFKAVRRHPLESNNIDIAFSRLCKKFRDPSLDVRQKIEVSGNILAQEYKIHLMPKNKYILPIIEVLLDECKKDEKLAATISHIKILAAPDQKNHEQIMPRIVIYSALGKENAQLVLNKIFTLLSNYYSTESLFVEDMPRFSAKISGLIYYAQGGGDLKNMLSDPEKEDLLSPSQVHFSWGAQDEHRLTIPKSMSSLAREAAKAEAQATKTDELKSIVEGQTVAAIEKQKTRTRELTPPAGEETVEVLEKQKKSNSRGG